MKLRRRASVVSVLVALGAAIACSRVANQTNFIGSPCNSDGDCPPDLTCWTPSGGGQKTCEPRCVNGASCADPKLTCENGACVVGSSSGGPSNDSGGGSGQTDSGGGGPGGTGSGKGDTLATDVSISVNGQGTPAAIDGTQMAYLFSGKNALGQQSNELRVRKLDGSNGEVTIATTSTGSFSTPVLTGGNVYWLLGDGPTTSLESSPSASASPNTLVGNTGQSGGTGLLGVGGYLFYGGGPGSPSLTRYTLAGGATEVVDSQILSNFDPKGVPAGTDGTNIYWVHGGGATDHHIFKASVASGTGTDTTCTFPSGVNMVNAFGATGSFFFFIVTPAQTDNLFAIDTSVGGSTASGNPIASWPANGQASAVTSSDGASLYAYVVDPNTRASAIKKFATTSTNSGTTVVDFGSNFNSSALQILGVDATSIYWAEMTSNTAGGASFRIARQAL